MPIVICTSRRDMGTHHVQLCGGQYPTDNDTAKGTLREVILHGFPLSIPGNQDHQCSFHHKRFTAAIESGLLMGFELKAGSLEAIRWTGTGGSSIGTKKVATDDLSLSCTNTFTCRVGDSTNICRP